MYVHMKVLLSFFFNVFSNVKKKKKKERKKIITTRPLIGHIIVERGTGPEY